MSKLYLIIICLFSGAGVWLDAGGLDPRKSITQYRLESWSRRDGFPAGTATSFCQTPDGWLWVGTNNGLARFDGERFTRFLVKDHSGLRSNMVVDLAATESGRIWILTTRGLSYYENQEFHAFTSLEIEYQNRLVLDHQNILWLGSGGQGVFRIEPDGEHTLYAEDAGLLNPRTNNLIHPRAGELLAATNSGVYRFDGERFVELFSGTVSGFWLEEDGALWANNFLDGLHRITPTGEITIFNETHGLNTNLVEHILQDGRGNLWMATDASGLIRFRNGRFETLDQRDGLVSNRMNRMFEDRDGNIWAACVGGISVLKPALFTTYTQGEGMAENTIHTVLDDEDGNLWCGGNESLTMITPSRDLEVIDEAQGFQSTFVKAMTRSPQGDLWFGAMGGGLYQVRDGGLIPFPHNQNPYVYAIAWLDRRLWVSSDGGGLHYFKQALPHEKDEVEVQYVVDPNGDPIFTSFMFAHSNGDLWVATNVGPTRWSGEDLKLFSDGLPSVFSRAFFEDSRKRLWLISGGKLCVLRDGRFQVVPVHIPPMANPYGIAEDGAGHFWVNTYDGVYRVKRPDLETSVKDPSRVAPARRFGMEHGLPSETGSGGTPNIIQARDGMIWIAARGGVAVVDPNQVPETETPPSPYIEQVLINDSPVQCGDALILPPGQHRIQIFFSAIDLNQAELLRFRYRMEPYDSEWIEVNRRDVLFNGLPPDSYQFQVAVSYDGVTWRESPEPVQIRLQPFFHQTVWFYPVCFLILITVGLGFFILRVRSLKTRARELQGLVDQRTASLRAEKEKTQELYEQLSEDNARKTQELEEARRLQLAMLPEHPPVIPDLEIGVYMKTATEVGGDYYDFVQDEEGVLTVAVGDATGHGIKAGLLVATTKSYFLSYGELSDSRKIVELISKSLKNLKLKGMFMALSLLKYQRGKASLLAAGMPPAMIWRKHSGEVEQILLKGLPLGGFLGFPYKIREFGLNPGDVVLLMSDGLPERFNGEKELLGEDRIQACFAQWAELAPDVIIEKLVQFGEDWAQGTPQDDDIAMVVMRVKVTGDAG